MSRSTVSRRVSEFVGVALFARGAHLDHRARQLRADRSGLVLQHRRARRRRRTSPAGSARSSPSCRSSCSATRSYLIPARAGRRRLALLLVPDARRGRHQGRPARRCCSPASARSSAWSSARSTSSGKPFRAGGYVGEWLAGELADYLNRTGSVIVVLTLIFLAIIMSTQFSFGRFFAAAARRRRAAAPPARSARSARGARSGGASKQRREVIAKHTKKGGAAAGDQAPAAAVDRAAPEAATKPRRREPRRPTCRAPARRARQRRVVRAAKPPKVTMPAPPLPLPDPEPRQGAGRAPQGRLRAAAAVAARRAEDRAQDRRARADGRRAPARGEVPRVLRRRQRRPDPSRARSSPPSSSSPTPA